MNTFSFLLTDILPYEIPLIFSNTSFYKYIVNENDLDKCSLESVIMKDTEPYVFNTKKNNGGIRRISLLHPLSQLHTLKFISEYGNEFIDFQKTNRTFSVRYPYKVAGNKNDVSEKFLEDLKIFNMDIDDSNLSEDERIGKTYFSIRNYVRITDFYRSNYFKQLEVKYNYMEKIDIKNCFDSIYTHSLEWAYFGSKYLAKDFIPKDREYQKTTRFSKCLDKVVRSTNFAETNGIPIGPEFSRTVSELLLCRIDKVVHDKLTKNNHVYKRDYEVVRFMDDIFIFSNNQQLCRHINEVYSEVCLHYKLHINNEKSYSEKKPFLRQHLWVTRLKRILAEQKEEIESGAIEYEDETTGDMFTNEINISFIYHDTINSFKQLLVDFEDQKSYIVSYVLSFAERNIYDIAMSLNEYADKIHAVSVAKRYVSFIQYVLSYSITAGNVIKFCKIIKIIKELLDLNEQNKMIIEDYIFKKTLDIIRFNSVTPIEIQNLIIMLKFFNNNIPENVFERILDSDSSYFILATIGYYISDGNRPRYYKKTIKKINHIVAEILENIDYRYSIKYDKNKKNEGLLSLLLSGDFYLLSDFRTLPILSKNNLDKLERIFSSISCHQWNGDKDYFINKFLKFIGDKKNTFINWNAVEENVVMTVVKRSMFDSGYS